MFFTIRREEAQALQGLADDTFYGRPLAKVVTATIENNADRKTVRGFEVRAGQWDATGRPTGWGVYPRWVYDDYPGLGVFGGPFVPLDKLRQLQTKDD